MSILRAQNGQRRSIADTAVICYFDLGGKSHVEWFKTSNFSFISYLIMSLIYVYHLFDKQMLYSPVLYL